MGAVCPGRGETLRLRYDLPAALGRYARRANCAACGATGARLPAIAGAPAAAGEAAHRPVHGRVVGRDVWRTGAVVIRHPAGYAGRLPGLAHDFNDFLDQPALMAASTWPAGR